MNLPRSALFHMKTRVCLNHFVNGFSIDKTVDSMDIHKSLNISIGTVMKNQEIVKLAPDHLKIKNNV